MLVNAFLSLQISKSHLRCLYSSEFNLLDVVDHSSLLSIQEFWSGWLEKIGRLGVKEQDSEPGPGEAVMRKQKAYKMERGKLEC